MHHRTALNARTGVTEKLTRIEVFESTARIVKGLAGSKGLTIPDVAQDFIEGPLVPEAQEQQA